MSENVEIRFLSPIFKGWVRAWECIRIKYGDIQCVDSDTNETWQYMGTSENEHQFRHRSLNGVRVIERVPVEDVDFDLDFDAYNGVKG